MDKLDNPRQHPVIRIENSCAVRATSGLWSEGQAKMYKRPNPRAASRTPLVFATQVGASGALISQWVPSTRSTLVPSGHRSRVGSIIDSMRLGDDAVRRPFEKWSPPSDYEWYAERVIPEAQRGAFIDRCKQWHAAHPPKVSSRPSPPVIDTEPILKLFAKYAKKGPPFEGSEIRQPTVPPLAKLKVAWELAGYPPNRVRKAVQHIQHLIDTSEERQEALEAIFAKYPSASKPTPKPKKVIKAVKKKMA